MTDTRTFTLDEAQSRYLVQHFALPADVRGMLNTSGRSQMTLTRSQRDALVELLGNRLQRKGFDADWEPTNDGVILESIIDALTSPRSQ